MLLLQLTVYSIQLQQHNTMFGLTKTDVEIGVCVSDGGFKGNLAQLTGRYNHILVHLYVLLNRASELNHSQLTVLQIMETDFSRRS